MGKIKRYELEEWDAVSTFSLRDASYLWQNCNPQSASFPLPKDVYRRSRILLSTLKNLRIFISETVPEDALGQELTRQVYISVAKTLRQYPKFLFPAKRRSKTGMKNQTKDRFKLCYDAVFLLVRQYDHSVESASRKAAGQLEMSPSTISRYYRHHIKLTGKESAIGQ